MKEFVINDRKLLKIECDTAWRDCPVFNMVFDLNNKKNPAYATTYKDNDVNGIRMEAFSEKVGELKEKIMNMCMDCNVQGR